MPYRDPQTGDLYPSKEFFEEQQSLQTAGLPSTFGVGKPEPVVKPTPVEEVPPTKEQEVSRIRTRAEEIAKQIEQLTKKVEAKKKEQELSADALKDTGTIDPTAGTSDVADTALTNNVSGINAEITSLIDFYEKQLAKIEKEKADALAAFEKTIGKPLEGDTFIEKLTGALGERPEVDVQKQLEEAQEKYKVPEWLEKVQQQSVKVAALQGEMNKMDVLQTGEIERIYAQPITMGSIQGQVKESGRKYNVQRAYMAAEMGAEAAVMAAYAGNLDQANDLATQAVDAYTYDIRQEIERFDNMFGIYTDYISDLEQDEQDLLGLVRQDMENQLELQTVEKTAVLDLMLQTPGSGINVNDSLDQATVKAVKWQEAQAAIPEAPELLSVAEAKSLGVPYGTTKEAAYGITPGEPITTPTTITPGEPLTPDQLSPLAKSVFDGVVGLKDLTPTQRAEIAPELNAAGWVSNLSTQDTQTVSFIREQMVNLMNSWKNVPQRYKGAIQGRLTAKGWIGNDSAEVSTFKSALGVVSQTLANLMEKGRLTDQDRIFYMSLMPTFIQTKEPAAQASADEMIRLLNQKLTSQRNELETGNVEPTQIDTDYINSLGL